MDDKFDKDLTNRISEVFEDYPYPAANEGWNELRKKFPEKKNNKIAWLWWTSAAAVLLVFLGIGMWLFNADKPEMNTVAHNKVKPISTDTPAGDISIKPADTHVIALQKPAAAPGKRTEPFINNNNLAGRHPFKKQLTQPTGILTQPVTKQPEEVSTADRSAIAIASAATSKTVPDSQHIAANHTNQPIIVQADIPAAAKINVPDAAKQPKQTKSIMDLLESEKNSVIVKKQTPATQDSKKVNFSVYAATYLNYASGSANQVNAGAGFTSDIRLSNNIKLSTGMSLAQNTLRYDNSPPTRGGSVAYATAAVIKQDVSNFISNRSVPQFQNYNARLVGLDIPVNIKYEFNPQKNDTYISAGLSSGTFIDERYTYSYQYMNSDASGANTTSTFKTNDETATSNFNSFYFGKMLNVSFGVGYPLGKSNRLIIEPFLKYPLAGLGAQQLRFGAGGLNLKINFKGAKK